MARNILFIMCDQLRADYLSCYGHLKLHTPNIDSLAERGVRFANAYCQAPLCGPSRASFYTGRYMSSHGVMANADPTRLDEYTIGDYLRPLGYRSALVGKADNRKDPEVLGAFGIDPASDYARAAACGGFEPFELHEGLYPDALLPDGHGYTRYLLKQGYQSKNPWQEFANCGVDRDGNLRSGWRLRNARYPARVTEEDSETAFVTRRAIDFLEQQDDRQPWCLHLSYIKPHWPLIAPAPYHKRYGADDVQLAIRSDAERDNPHPVIEAFMQQEYSESWMRDEVRELAIPVYMGLVKQVDDQLGRLFAYLEERRLFDNTMIVFTSDHGEYLGDHWLGEKDLLHDVSARIPLLVVNPNPTADETRGSVRNEMVEAIDLLPTFIEFAGGIINHERTEGHSLMPLLRSLRKAPDWRDCAISEIDYAERGARTQLGLSPYECRAVMVRHRRWKYIYYNGFRAQLFDLEKDPQELHDLGDDPACAGIRGKMMKRLVNWQRGLKPRIGVPFQDLDGMGPARDEERGIIIGRW